MSSSFPVLPTTLGERYPKLPDSQQASMERELAQQSPAVISPMSSNSGVVGHLFSLSSGFSTDLHFSSVPQQEKHPRQSHLISQSNNNGTSVMFSHSIDSEVLLSTASSHFNKEENNSSWCTDSLPDFLDYPISKSIQNNQLERIDYGGIAIPSEDLTKHNDWQEWADQLITDNSALTSNWNELLADASIADPEPQALSQSHRFSSRLSFPSSSVLLRLSFSFKPRLDFFLFSIFREIPARADAGFRHVLRPPLYIYKERETGCELLSFYLGVV
ncbi:phosphate starvation response 1 [Abeliophyllum distichum]|uniref:Phosphate starvation response 1 n=1 Tax=Abeliophyllum distichum TaxID=126358 RepID=A0ABD1PTR6_9LAMI